MSTTITCPNCAHHFEPSVAMEEAINKKFAAQYNQKWAEQSRKQKDEILAREEALRKQQEQLEAARRNQESDIKKRVDEECERTKVSLQKQIEEQTAHSFGAKLRFLEEQKLQSEEQLKESRRKELEFLRKEDDFRKREETLELEKQRMIQEERTRIIVEVRKNEEERSKLRQEEMDMKLRELEKQLDDQKKLAQEALRKAEQGSMQLQGEVQELALEALLRTAFPYDTIKEVGKGVRGADCILTVRNAFGNECGCIIFESKRTQAFGIDWIEKLKADMQSCNAELAVIVTQAFPKDMDRFGERQGVYICSFPEVKALVSVLRNVIIKIYEARISQENKGDKMVMLYDYLTGSEFMVQWNTMRESFGAFRQQLQKERDDFEKNWKKKEKMLDLIIKNSLQISGSIEGISGMESMNWTGLVQDSNLLLD